MTRRQRTPARRWFDQGHDAFARTFPTVAAKVSDAPFYVCPLCLLGFPEEALAVRWLTCEHVPPRSVGGRRLVLTCKACNNKAGHDMDGDMRREADLYDFAAGYPSKRTAVLHTESGRVPVRFSVADHGIQIFGVPRATHPRDRDAVWGDFDKVTFPDGWRDFQFSIEFVPFSAPRAAASWLRSAYLAFFAVLGYHFIFRHELDVVRRRIADPESKELATFRIIQPKPVPEPTLLRVNEPALFRSYAMAYGRNVVFLPRYCDNSLYSRLSTYPDCNVKFEGLIYPWPTRPKFWHDRLTERHAHARSDRETAADARGLSSGSTPNRVTD